MDERLEKMQLNTNKCKVIHFGKVNSNFPYLIEDEKCSMKYSEDLKSEKDIGLIFEANLKCTKQIKACVNKANSLLGMLSRTLESRVVNIWKHLYISMVRPHLEKRRKRGDLI